MYSPELDALIVTLKNDPEYNGEDTTGIFKRVKDEHRMQ